MTCDRTAMCNEIALYWLYLRAFSLHSKLKKKDFAAVATRWGGEKAQVVGIMESIAASIQQNIDEVLELSRLPGDRSRRYREAVAANIACSIDYGG
jgi:hypothetical protein